MSVIPTVLELPSGTITDRMLNRAIARISDLFKWVESRRVTKFPITAHFRNIQTGDAAGTRRIRIRPPFAMRITGATLNVRAASGWTTGDVTMTITNSTRTVTVTPVASTDVSSFRRQAVDVAADDTITVQISDPAAALDSATITLNCEHVATGLGTFLAPIIRPGETFDNVNDWFTNFAAACAGLLTRRRHWAVAVVSTRVPTSGANNQHQLTHGVTVSARLDRHCVDVTGGTSATGTLGYAATTRTTGAATAGTLLSENPALDISTTDAQNGLYLYSTNTGAVTRVVQVLYLSRSI